MASVVEMSRPPLPITTPSSTVRPVYSEGVSALNASQGERASPYLRDEPPFLSESQPLLLKRDRTTSA